MTAASSSITRLALGAPALAACTGPQSALDPAGRGAERIADLFWVMTASGFVIWAAVIGLAIHAIHRTREGLDAKSGTRLIIGGGVILPTFLLTGLLTYGLAMLPPLLAAAPDGSSRISVTGEQWWWRVRYLGSRGEAIDLANEIRLPVDAPVEFQLDSPDVIHSFWIPALGGKVDMIPGRKTRLLLEPTRTGVFRGVCAEYCGASHAHMSFSVVVLEKNEFADWLAQQARPARSNPDPLAMRGQELFSMNGCGACHTIRGTEANGVVGPDLTHVGSRLSLGAGVLPNEAADFARWLARTEQLKPHVLMPEFGMLPAADLRALATYLEGLK